MEIVKLLIEKSQEAFIVGIELYNKPTIHYRVEGFSFFICNAWELMLKAYLVREKGEQAIYYKNNPNRTITLENCIKMVFTNDKDPLRKNLEQIVELRNTSTHFVTEEYEQIYVPLFQANVFNYIRILLNLFEIDITDRLGNHFLTLSVKMNDFSEEAIMARYPKQMATRIINAMSQVGKEILEENNESYAIHVKHDFYITKDIKSATAKIVFTKDANQAGIVMKELHDMQNECPYTMSKCLDIINQRIEKEKINFVNPAPSDENKRHKFNSWCFGLFVKFYNLKADEKYCYVYKRNQNPTYTYSMAAIDMIVEQIKKDPEHIIQSLRDNMPNKKGSQPQGQRNSKP